MIFMQLLIGVLQFSMIYILAIKIIEHKNKNKILNYLVENSKRFGNSPLVLMVMTIFMSNFVGGFVGELIMLVGILNYELAINKNIKQYKGEKKL